MIPQNYVPYHVHSMLSNGVTNIDSITDFHEYIDVAKKLGMKAFGFSEHGCTFAWLKKKEYIESCGMKYIHAVEAYLTADDELCDHKTRDNYHVVLIAKNYDGVKELNKLVSKSFTRNDFHFYYVPRIGIKELLKTSNNIIVTSACLGGVLPSDDPYCKELFLEFLIRNKDRCFLEIQHHNCEDQIEYNKCLYQLHQDFGIRLIAGTDTHALNNEHMDGRSLLQVAKGVHFENEDDWDLTFKSLDELISAYKKQNTLPIDVIYEAINNTNAMADMVEEFQLDYSPKYPKLYDDSDTVFKKKINEGVISRGINKYPNYKSDYLPRIRYEYDVYKKNGAIDFMLLEENYKSAMRKQGIKYGYSRGSVSGSVIAYLLYITEIDSVKYNLNFERFMNTERVSLADVDTDWYSEDRKYVKDYLYSKEGLYCCDIVTFNTIALKGAIDDVCRGLNRRGGEFNADEIKNLCETNEELARKKYPKVFKYVDMVNGCVVSVGNHPAGCVISPVPVDEWFGTFTTSTNVYELTSDGKPSHYPISVLNMKEIDSLNFVKLDILGLDNIGLIYKTCEAANIPFATPDNIPSNDINVWNSIKEDTTMIFQWESQTATKYLQKLMSDKTIQRIKEQNPNFSYMDLLSMGNGAIRPAGESYRDQLADGIYKDNGNKELNEFLAPTLGFLVFQEEIIEFLHSFCGFTMGEADVVRRCVSSDSQILMADDSTKAIKDVKIGDVIKTIDESINGKYKITTNKVVEVYNNHVKRTMKIIATNGHEKTELNLTEDHKVFTLYGWKAAKDLCFDDVIAIYNIHSKTWEWRIIEQNYIDCYAHVYDLQVEENHNYIANYFVVHNCFAKKTGTEPMIPIIKNGGEINKGHHIDGFIYTMNKKYGTSKDEAEKIIVDFLQVIEDASSYLFSKNHSDPYSWIGYICGYLRYYYPLEFITSALNIFADKEDKSIAITNYAKRNGIKIQPIKFRHSIAKYSFNKENNEIFKGIASIKYMNVTVANEIYELRENKYNTFIDLLFDLKEKTTLNSKQLNILINLDFFEEFGDANYLLKLTDLAYNFSLDKNKKLQIRKDKLDKLGIDYNVVKPYAQNETEKTFTKVDCCGFLNRLSKSIKVQNRTLRQRVEAQLAYLGYIDIKDSRYNKIGVVISVNTKYSPRLTVYSLKNGSLFDCKIDKRTFNRNKLQEGDIISIKGSTTKPKMRKLDDGTFETIQDTLELWITNYNKLENL